MQRLHSTRRLSVDGNIIDKSVGSVASLRLLFVALFVLLSIALYHFAARALHMESGHDELRAWLFNPGQGLSDSWRPMIAALNWLQQPHQDTIYQAIFFQQHIKFQYPLTSLFPLELMRAAGIPISPHSLNVAGWMWIVVTALAMAGFAAVLAQRGGVISKGNVLSRLIVMVMAIILTLTFYPIMYAYTIGQAQTWIDSLFIFGCLAWVLDRRFITGMLVGAICLLKPQFTLFLIWGALRRSWPFLFGWGTVIIPAGMTSVALFGLANNLDYLRVLQFLSAHGENYFDNQSVNGLLNRLFFLGNSLIVPPVFPPYHAVVYYGTHLSSLALITGALFFYGRAAERGTLMDFMTAALTFTIASPIAWGYHYGILPPIFIAIIFALALKPGNVHPSLWGVLGVAYFFTSNYLPITNLTAETPLNFMQSYLLFAALLTLWLLYRLAALEGFEHRRVTADEKR